MLAEVVVQMVLPLLGGDALAHERLDVVVDVRQEDVEAAEHALEVEEEVGAFLVGDGAVRVVGVLARLKVDDEPLVLGLGGVLLERVGERFGADEEGETAVGGGVEKLEEEALDVGRPAFVEPEVGRVGLPVTYDGLGGAGLTRRGGGKRTLRHCRTTSESFRAQLHRPVIWCVRF